MNVRIVTGYHRLDAHRSHGEYVRLGNKLLTLPVPITFFCERGHDFDIRENVEVMPAGQYWLSEMISSRPSGIEPRRPLSDNPEKDTVAFHVVQHQKTKWLAQAAVDHPFDMLVWVDLGIFHVPGVTAEGVLSLVERAAKLPTDKITLASIWGPPKDVALYSQVGWHCAGGVAIVPGTMAAYWHGLVVSAANELFDSFHRVTYEVNDWTAAWILAPQSFRHYLCDHNHTILEAA
jgi:hypothetical protein